MLNVLKELSVNEETGNNRFTIIRDLQHSLYQRPNLNILYVVYKDLECVKVTSSLFGRRAY